MNGYPGPIRVRRPFGGFTLIELLTVMFIIAILAGLLIPALARYRQQASVQQARRSIETLKGGVEAYRSTFQSYPPSEPDAVDSRSGNTVAAGFYGSSALRIYMIGHVEGDSYRIVSDRGQWNGSGWQNNKGWGPFVKGIPLNGASLQKVNNRGWAGTSGVFVDTWGNAFEYFLAFRNRGNRTCDIFPRACDSALPSGLPGVGSSSSYDFTGENGGVVGGYGIRIPVMRWDDWWSSNGKIKNTSDLSAAENYDTGNSWAAHSTPVNASTFLIVSRGPDGNFGGNDDVGNW
ncbi:MAG: hypothetical protein BIFFINMI_00982 [Phycisphaerae bacterium]|nr:hypothetical protein [Phycisphaerae bacterium]